MQKARSEHLKGGPQSLVRVDQLRGPLRDKKWSHLSPRFRKEESPIKAQVESNVRLIRTDTDNQIRVPLEDMEPLDDGEAPNFQPSAFTSGHLCGCFREFGHVSMQN